MLTTAGERRRGARKFESVEVGKDVVEVGEDKWDTVDINEWRGVEILQGVDTTYMACTSLRKHLT